MSHRTSDQNVCHCGEYGGGVHTKSALCVEAAPSNEVFDLPPAIYGSGYVGMTRLKYETLQRRLNLREEQIDGYERQLGIIDADASRTIGLEIAHLQRTLKAFRHLHVAHYEDGKLTDKCGQCGLDIRNEVHLRVTR